MSLKTLSSSTPLYAKETFPESVRCITDVTTFREWKREKVVKLMMGRKTSKIIMRAFTLK